MRKRSIVGNVTSRRPNRESESSRRSYRTHIPADLSPPAAGDICRMHAWSRLHGQKRKARKKELTTEDIVASQKAADEASLSFPVSRLLSRRR